MLADHRHAQAEIKPRIPRLPKEVINNILEMLGNDGQWDTLASVACVDRSMYEVVIPILYQTVAINERNKDNIGYGHSLSLELDDGESHLYIFSRV